MFELRCLHTVVSGAMLVATGSRGLCLPLQGVECQARARLGGPALRRAFSTRVSVIDRGCRGVCALSCFPGVTGAPTAACKLSSKPRAALQKPGLHRTRFRQHAAATPDDAAAGAAANTPIEVNPSTAPLVEGGQVEACQTKEDKLLQMEIGKDDDSKPSVSGRKQLDQMPGSLPHFFAALFGLYGLNFSLGNLTKAAGIQFPSALIGMFSIITVLFALERFSPAKAEKLVRWFDPATLWIQRWLGAFYVPSLAILPLTIKGIAGTSLLKMFGVIAVGMPLTLLSTAQVAALVRRATRTEMLDAPLADALPPFGRMHFMSWGVVAVASVALASFNPGWAMYMSFPCLLASTIGGTLIGSLLPSPANRILHPIIVTCLAINAGAAVFGAASGMGYEPALQSYLPKDAAMYGAGNFLMSFLGVIILSFAFKIFDQRKLMVRHAPEILGSCALSAVISMGGTAALCRLSGLDPSLTISLIPRSVTMALALPIAAQLHASAGITALAVMLTGLLGANFAQILLDAGKFKDPITRGLSAAGAGHGLGTAAMAATEPEALPFCALAYALIGIMSTVLIATPGTIPLLLSIAGQ